MIQHVTARQLPVTGQGCALICLLQFWTFPLLNEKKMLLNKRYFKLMCFSMFCIYTLFGKTYTLKGAEEPYYGYFTELDLP